MSPEFSQFIIKHQTELLVVAAATIAISALGLATIENAFRTIHIKDLALIRWLHQQSKK